MEPRRYQPPSPQSVRLKIYGTRLRAWSMRARRYQPTCCVSLTPPLLNRSQRDETSPWLAVRCLRWCFFFLLRLFAISTSLAALLAVTTLALNGIVVMLRYQSHASTPLAVNLNHPFMDAEPMGEARVMVRLADGGWIQLGQHRVRTVPDELLGGHTLVEDTDDYPPLGHFSTSKEVTPALTRHLALINQAMALRDAVNDVHDPIEDARDRERIDTGLLERSWLEDEEAVDVESPLVSFFRGKE